MGCVVRLAFSRYNPTWGGAAASPRHAHPAPALASPRTRTPRGARPPGDAAGSTRLALPRASPCAILRDQAGVPGLVARQPPVLLCHGSADTSAPPSESAKFAKALRAAGVESVGEKYYPGKTHTDPFVTDPILGGHDALLEDIVAFVRKGETALKLPALPRLLPKPLVDIARTMVPF